MRELELTDLNGKHQHEITKLTASLTLSNEAEVKYSKSVEAKQREISELNAKLQNKCKELDIVTEDWFTKHDKLNKQFEQAKIIKIEAVNKLAEVMARRDNNMINKKGAKQESWTTNLKKRDKEYRKLNIDLQTMREKYNSATSRHQKELQVSYSFKFC